MSLIPHWNNNTISLGHITVCGKSKSLPKYQDWETKSNVLIFWIYTLVLLLIFYYTASFKTQSFPKVFHTWQKKKHLFPVSLCRHDSRRGTSSMCNLRAWAPVPHQRQRVPGRLARSQWWNHKLWQLPVCHADGVPVHHHGRLDGRSLLGTKAPQFCDNRPNPTYCYWALWSKAGFLPSTLEVSRSTDIQGDKTCVIKGETLLKMRSWEQMFKIWYNFCFSFKRQVIFFCLFVVNVQEPAIFSSLVVVDPSDALSNVTVVI